MNGDSTDFKQLIRQYAAPLVLYARQFFGHADFHAAEEIVQDAFFRLSRERNPPEKPVAWLYRTVRHRAISAARSEKRRKKRETCREMPLFQPDSVDPIEAKEIAQALRHLDLEQREIVTMHIWSDLSFAEIGILLGKPKTTLFRRYEEALDTLRQLLASNEHDF